MIKQIHLVVACELFVTPINYPKETNCDIVLWNKFEYNFFIVTIQ